MMNCQEALELLYDILDKEASEINSKEVKEHLSKCSDCFKKFQIEEQVQLFLNEKLANDPVPQNVSNKLDSLKSKISLELDNIDTENCSESSGKKKYFSISRILISAAALVIMVFTGFSLSGYVKHFKNYEPLESAHLATAKNLALFASAGSGSDYFTALSNQFGDNLKSDVMGFSLVGGQREKIMGVPMEHLVFSDNGALVSVFIVSKDQFTIPSELLDNSTIFENIEYFDHHCQGCHLVYHTIGNLIIITATENHDLKLKEFNLDIRAI